MLVSDVPKKFASFDDVVAQRRAEARRSLVVQVNSESSFSELYGYCSKYAEINGIHHYKNSGGEVLSIFIISGFGGCTIIMTNTVTYLYIVLFTAFHAYRILFRRQPQKCYSKL